MSEAGVSGGNTGGLELAMVKVPTGKRSKNRTDNGRRTEPDVETSDF